VAVVRLDVLPVTVHKLGNRQVGSLVVGQPAVAGLPLDDEALVLGLAGGGVVLAEKVVLAPAGDGIGEGDDGLAGLFVTAVKGDADLGGHGGLPGVLRGRFRALYWFSAPLSNADRYA
jgi:hypothetical protein